MNNSVSFRNYKLESGNTGTKTEAKGKKIMTNLNAGLMSSLGKKEKSSTDLFEIMANC